MPYIRVNCQAEVLDANKARLASLLVDIVMGQGASERLASVAVPDIGDVDISFASLQACISRTRAFLSDLTAEQIDGSEDRPVVLNPPNGRVEFRGIDYLLSFALPNFYFHLFTAFAILRHSGVPIGKADYLGSFPRER